MCDWTEFYEGRLLNSGYQAYAAHRYAPYLLAIIERAKRGDRIVEVGCGLATMTRILADRIGPQGVGFHAFDISQDMVGYARQTLWTGHNIYGGYPVDLGDARLPTGIKPDIVHSHGMLEHFTDEDIRKVIEAHRADGARHAIHYVPGEKYGTPSFGDERLMPLSFWQQFGTHEAFAFNDGHDYCLIWNF